MEKIIFTKEINYSILKDAIRLRTSLNDVVYKIEYSFNQDPDAEPLIDNLVLHCNRALLSDERDELVTLVNAIDDTYDLVVREKIKFSTTKQKMEFGHDFLSMLSANNEYYEKTGTQISTLLAMYPNLIMCCLTGSIETLLGLVQTMVPDENISADELAEFTKRIEIFLGSLGG